MKRILALIIISSLSFGLFAHEGMWMLNMLKRLNEGEMQHLGLKLTADDIYNINQSSIKDAIVRLNGGMCTAEIISPEGLTLTNHHCAFDAIQSHSSVDNDYLTDGFWAMSKKEELPIEGMFASFLDRIEDVTTQVLEGIDEDTDPSERAQTIRERIGEIEKAVTDGTKYEARVSSFFEGNEYYMMVYVTYNDVRLVGAPPSAIGKFGGDTDNWMWPRHTGDFSMLRIYTAPDGSSAEYSEDNIPYKPKHHLPVSLNGVQENDFAMILGFPGSTDRYLSSFGVKMALEIDQPARIKIRGEKLRIMKEDMDASSEVRIKYASKYAGISNYYKYFQGQSRGLKRLKVYDKKQQLENEFNSWVASSGKSELYGNTTKSLEEGYAGMEKYKLADTYLQEAAFGSELLIMAYRATRLNMALGNPEEQDAIKEATDKLKTRAEGFFKDYNPVTDKKVTSAMMKMYQMDVLAEYHPEFFGVVKKKYKNNWGRYVDMMFAKSVFSSQDKLDAFLTNPTEKVLAKDPAFVAFNQFLNIYRGQIAAGMGESADKVETGYRQLVAGLREMNPDKKYYPNANSTMRLTYGQVGDYVPADGVIYNNVTTTDGIIQKEDPDNDEFIVPGKLKELVIDKDFGQYADKNGNMTVCFISNNDITGGNSGSPVLNGEGQLIGIAFDGNWEAMSGDIAFEPELQRTISVDIRYVLFVVDKYAGAKHLIDEMTLVKSIKKESAPMPDFIEEGTN